MYLFPFWLPTYQFGIPFTIRSSTTILTESLDDSESVDYLTQTDHFRTQSSSCRDFLKTHLSSSTLDNLMMEVQHRADYQKSGFFFTMASLCSDRILYLSIAPADDNRYSYTTYITTFDVFFIPFSKYCAGIEVLENTWMDIVSFKFL